MTQKPTPRRRPKAPAAAPPPEAAAAAVTAEQERRARGDVDTLQSLHVLLPRLGPVLERATIALAAYARNNLALTRAEADLEAGRRVVARQAETIAQLTREAEQLRAENAQLREENLAFEAMADEALALVPPGAALPASLLPAEDEAEEEEEEATAVAVPPERRPATPPAPPAAGKATRPQLGELAEVGTLLVVPKGEERWQELSDADAKRVHKALRLLRTAPASVGLTMLKAVSYNGVPLWTIRAGRKLRVVLAHPHGTPVVLDITARSNRAYYSHER